MDEELKASYFFIVSGAVSKARPRVTHGRAYMPKPYMDWRKLNIPMLQEQLKAFPASTFPLEGKRLFQMSIYNDLRSDLDNIQAGVMDLFQDAGIIEHDRPTIASQFDVLFFPCKKANSRVLVTIAPAVKRLHHHDLFH